MLQAYLINILIFCGIILLIVLTVAAIQSIIILVEVKRTTKEVKKKVYALTSVIDVVSLVLGGVEGAKKRFIKRVKPNKETLIAFMAGLKKGLQVLLKK